MLRLDKVIKPWKEAASLNDHINLYGFWNETAFLTKSGDVGMVLSIPGVDYESLDHTQQEYAVKRLEAALKAFGPGFHVYQYLFKSNRPEIPFASYDDPVVNAATEQRRQFFESKRDHLYQVEIFYAIVLEGPRSKSGVGAAFAQLFRDPAGAMGELRTQFTNDSMKVLLRSQIENELARLEQKVQAFSRQLADFMQIEVLGQQEQFRFFRRLLNYDEWRIAGKPQSTQFLDYQVVNSNIEAERDHLRVGDHVVRVLTMKEAITETKPLVLDALLKIPANFYVVTEWMPLATDKARKEVNKRRRHFNMSKTGFVSQMGNDATKTNPRDVLVDESKQADIENLGDCLRALGDGQSLGDFSLTIVVYAPTKPETDQLIGEFASVFTNADGNLFVETYNQLNAYFATVPGGYATNLRKLYLLNTNYADLSFLFTILPGEKRNAHLDAEYLAVLETDNSTPYFLNLHNGEVPHTLILGMTGSGKSYLCSFLLQNAQKYAPLTFIFDIGGSFQSLTHIFGGSYLNVGQDIAAAQGDPALASATPAQQAAIGSLTPTGQCVPGQPCPPAQSGYGQPNNARPQLTPEQQQAQQIAAKERERADESRFASNLVYVRGADQPQQTQAAGPVAAASQQKQENSSLVPPHVAGEQPEASEGYKRPVEANIDSATLSRLLVESSILLAASRGNPSTILKEAAAAYKVDTDAIAAKVRQEFTTKEKAKTAQAAAKAPKKAA